VNYHSSEGDFKQFANPHHANRDDGPISKRSVDVNIFSFVLHGLANDRRGVTALEYGLIAAVMGALIVTAMTTLGTDLGSAFTTIGALLTTKASSM
jgi:pilus assembly protein Flp/PilA